MTESIATQPQPRRRARSVAAIAVGFVVVAVLSLATDQVLHTLAVYPPWGQPMRDPALNLLALTYRIIYTVLGGYIAARLAPHGPRGHALILGVIGLVVATAGAVAAIPMDLGPVWYPVALAVTALPCTWLGGLLQALRADAMTAQRGSTTMPTITPFLWYDGAAEDAANFYVSIFRNAKVLAVHRAGGAGPGAPGAVISVTFEVEGQGIIAFNGGPHFTFSPAISLFVRCETQSEVDELWGKLSAGGEEQPCGWLKDKYGVSWQVIPAALSRMLGDPDPARAGRAMEAMLQMKKIDLARLTAAYDGVGVAR
jgi:predicted 3-demethylubiquinone-9 3-methyltransferase (glyoxalase superfamily)